MKHKKCLLIYPPTGLYDRWDRCQSPIESETIEIIRPPEDLAYIASSLENLGIKCVIRDYHAEKNRMLEDEGEIGRAHV